MGGLRPFPKEGGSTLRRKGGGGEGKLSQKKKKGEGEEERSKKGSVGIVKYKFSNVLKRGVGSRKGKREARRNTIEKKIRRTIGGGGKTHRMGGTRQ